MYEITGIFQIFTSSTQYCSLRVDIAYFHTYEPMFK